MTETLRRVVGVPGAISMGLGSILGTGIFVSIGIAAGIAGPWVLLATALAACVATFNGLSSAQLAASHPVSGGTYEYGYRYLHPTLGFLAGWMFLCAKTASAATAALGFAGYLLTSFGVSDVRARVGLALAAIAVLTAVVARGMQRSNRLNAAIVSATVFALLAFAICGASSALANVSTHVDLTLTSLDPIALLEATALMFVAYTGYGRIATLGEEVSDPSRSIPRAIVLTLVLSAVLYNVVAFVAIGAIGADALAKATRSVAAPLEIAARTFEVSEISWIVGAGAITAMLGVLLNLLLGLSRVLLAMARRGDMPRALAHLSPHGSPDRAVIATGVAIAALASTGSVVTTWSFSAFTVLVYYALTNLAALRLPAADRRYPHGIAAMGLVSCASLAFWVETSVWLAGLAWIAIGLVWHRIALRTRATV